MAPLSNFFFFVFPITGMKFIECSPISTLTMESLGEVNALGHQHHLRLRYKVKLATGLASATYDTSFSQLGVGGPFLGILTEFLSIRLWRIIV